MAVTTPAQEYKRLRSYLNPYLKGKNVDAVLNALATGASSYLINSAAAVNDQLYVVTASGQYLDQRLADYGIVRPPSVGLPDSIFREIGIQVKNRKTVRDLINNLLDAMFGDQYTRATSDAGAVEPYALEDGDTLIINFDRNHTATVTFSTSQFTNINAATAQEVADAITIALRNVGYSGTAISNNDGDGNYVQLLSNTIGPASSVTVQGGSAQNELLFDSIIQAGGDMFTQWAISLQPGAPGGVIRFTWIGGGTPNLGKVQAGDYVNIFGGGFASSPNEGSYTIIDSVGGAVGTSYFEIQNPLGTPGIVTQGANDAILFYNPVERRLSSLTSYAAVYQTESRTLQVFLPATTQVIGRTRVGTAFIHDPSDPISSLPNQPGPNMFDLTQNFTVSYVNTTLAQDLNANSPKVFSVADSSQFPDSSGYIILGYGTQNQEGPIPYIGTPSGNTILLSPIYTIKNRHVAGENVFFVAQNSSATITPDGLNYPFFITDVVSGRVYAQELIKSVAATGINIVFTILYPDDIGLGKWGTQYSEISQVYGP